MDDHELLFAADPTGIFIGELDGVIISSLCVVKFGDNHAFLGHNIVDKPYRGKGYMVSPFLKLRWHLSRRTTTVH